MKRKSRRLEHFYLVLKIGTCVLIATAIMLYVIDIGGQTPDAFAPIRSHIVRHAVWYSKRRDRSTNEMAFYQVENAVLEDHFTEQQFRAAMEKQGIYYLASAKFSDAVEETFSGAGVTVNYQAGSIECWRKLNALSVLRVRLQNGGRSPFGE